MASGWSLSGAELIAEAERGQFVSGAGAMIQQLNWFEVFPQPPCSDGQQ